jgi:hypothetical protein
MNHRARARCEAQRCRRGDTRLGHVDFEKCATGRPFPPGSSRTVGIAPHRYITYLGDAEPIPYMGDVVRADPLNSDRMKHSRFLVGVLALVLAASACSESSESSENEVASNTTRPCAEQGQPALAAYDRKNGKLQWAVCASEDVRRAVLVATEKHVYLTEYHRSGSTRSTAFDAATGKPAPDAESPTIPLSTGPDEGTVIDNVRITGGQDDPTFATDASTGKLLWSQPGSPPYDDVWAIADGAVSTAEGQHGPLSWSRTS